MAATIRNQTESQRIANQRISTTAERQAAQRATVGATDIVKDGVAVTHERQSKILKEHAKDYNKRAQSAIDSIKHQADIWNLFVESGTKKQTIEEAAIFLSEQNKSLENTESYSVIPSIDDVNTTGYKAAEGGFDELSGFSKKAYEKATSVSDTIRAGTPILEEKLNTKVPGVGTVMGFPVRSTANLIEMSGMVPGGVETMARHPGVIAPAFGRGAYDATIGTAKAFKENPAQTTSDIVTAALFFGGAGKLAGSTRTVGSRVPRVTRTTVQPDILIKGEIPLATAPKVQAPTPGLVPYKGKPMPGMELSPFKPKAQGKTPIPPYSEPNFFIGERLGPTAAEGYIRVPAKMAKTLQKEYTFSGARNVKTDFGSFVELEGITPRAQPKTGDFQRIAQAQDRIMLGELPKGKSSKIKNPYRIEHQLKIEPADLEVGKPGKLNSDVIVDGSVKPIDLRLKESKNLIPEKTKGPYDPITAQEQAYAKILTTALRDEKMYYDAIDTVSARVLGELGVKNRKGIGLSIRDTPFEDNPFTVGRSHMVPNFGPIVEFGGTKFTPPEITINTIGHEFGHITQRGGWHNSPIIAESVAESFGNKFGAKFEELYGIKVPKSKTYQDWSLKERIQNTYALGSSLKRTPTLTKNIYKSKTGSGEGLVYPDDILNNLNSASKNQHDSRIPNMNQPKYKDPVREIFPERMFEPQPQFKQAGKVALKERGNNIALNDIQNIFERSKAMHEAESRINVRARPKGGVKPHSRAKAGGFPAFSLAASGPKPSSDVFISARPRASSGPKSKEKFNTIIAPATKSKASPLPDFAPSVAPAPKPSQVPSFGFDEFKTAATLTNPPIEPPYVKPKADRRVSKKKRGKRSADYYQVTNPIKDIAELMKQ